MICYRIAPRGNLQDSEGEAREGDRRVGRRGKKKSSKDEITRKIPASAFTTRSPEV